MVRPALGAAVLRGMRARGLLSVGSVLLAVLAVASAVLGPAFQVAVSRSYAVSRLADATPALTGLTWTFRPDADYTGEAAAAGDRAVAAIEELGGAAAARWTPLQPQWETEPLRGLGGEADLLAKAGACERLEIRGRCPERAGEVLLLDGDRERTGLAIGERTRIAAVGSVRVVGTYRAPQVDDPFWFDVLRFVSEPARANPATGETTPFRPAPLLTARSTFDALPAGRWRVRVDGPLRVSPAWTLADLPPAVAAADRLGEAEVDVDGGEVRGESVNDLAAVAAEVRTEQAAARASVGPAVLSLVLVALALLLRLLLAASELRVAELALASLRGVRARRLWGLGLAEPLALLTLAAPLGLLVGVGLAWGLVRWWLVPGLPVPLPAASLVAAALVLAGAVAVALLAVGLVLRVSLAGQLAGARRPGASSRWSLVAQLVLVAAAVAVLGGTLGSSGGSSGSSGGGGRPDAADLVLPVLLAVVAGLGAVRGTAAAARWWTRRGSGTRSLAGFVAVRALSRRAEGTLVILPLTAAVAVAVFAVGVADAAATWRASVAATRAPAGEVWASPLGLAETVDLTHALDPDGRWLMTAGAAALGNTRLSVVDAPRLARVSAWPDQWSPGVGVDEVADELDRPGAVPEPRGSRVGLSVTADVGEDRPLFLELRLRPFGEDTQRVYVGPFRPDGTSTADARVPCPDRCALEGLSLGGRAALSLPLDGEVRLERMTVDGEPFAVGLAGAGWSPSPDAADTSPLTGVTEEGGVVRLALSDEGGAGVVRLSSGGVPARLPVVLGRDARGGLERRAGGPVLTLPTGELPVAPALVTESTPLVGPVGVLVDATLLANDRTFYDATLETSVLARADTPGDLREALAGQGLSVTTTQAGTRDALDVSAYALALRLYLVVAALALLMALAGLLVSTAVQLPQRRRDAAALRVVGVPRRTVAGAVLRELLVVLGSAAVAGIAAGTLAQSVVLRTITLGTVGGGTEAGQAVASTPRVVADVDPLRLVVTALLAVAVLGVVAAGSALLTVRGARGATLREDG